MGKVKIGDLFELEKGELQSSKSTEGEYDFITAAQEWKTHNEFTHDMEALIFAAMASGSLGRTHYVNGKFITSDLCYILTPKNSEKYPINLKFYHFVFNSLRDEIVKNTKSGTSKESINKTNLKNYEIPYFDIGQQDLWIQKLLNTKVTKEELEDEISQQKELLKKLRQSILQDAIEGKLTAPWREENPDVESAAILLEKIKTEKEQKIKKQKPLSPISDDEIRFEIPDNWEWCRLGEVINIKSGKRIHAADYKKDGVPFLRSGEIGSLGRGESLKNELFISQEKYLEIKEKFGVPKRGDILIACIGGSIGNTWVVDNREFYYKDGNLVLFESIEEIETSFLLYYLSSPFFWKHTILNATDTSYNALTIVKLNVSLFPLPPYNEQKEIVKKVESLFAICNELEEQINSSKTNTETLMQAVLKEASEK